MLREPKTGSGIDMAVKPRGRPRRYAEYEKLLAELPKLMTKRPRYVNWIGVFRGATGDTAWLKLRLPNGCVYKGKRYACTWEGYAGVYEIEIGEAS